jgi:hypothetical protein
LSYAQQRLWFMEQLEPGSGAYHIPLAVRLKGVLDEDSLRNSLQAIVQRHEVLRSRFVDKNGQLVQIIDNPGMLDLRFWDLSQDPEEERQRRALSIVDQETRTPFHLSKGPLLRAGLLRLSPEEHILTLTLHHVVSDGWAMNLLVQEFSVLYSALHRGQPGRMPDLHIQYADYAAWQRGWLKGEVLEVQLSYWRRQLAGAPALELPTDWPRPVVPAHRGKTEVFEVGIQTAEILKALSQREGVTLFMTLLSALAVVLGHASRQEDLLIGTDVANRNHLHTERLIGFFVNQLVLRVNLSGNPTLRELFKRVRQTTLAAYTHQDVPFEKVVEDLAPERSLARAPLFQVKFVLQNTPQEEFQLPDLAVESLEVEDTTSKFDMLLNMADTGQGLAGWNQYDSDLWEASTARSLMSLYCACLQFVASTDKIMDTRMDDLIRGAEQLMRRSLEETSGVVFRKRHTRQHAAASNA